MNTPWPNMTNPAYTLVQSFLLLFFWQLGPPHVEQIPSVPLVGYIVKTWPTKKNLNFHPGAWLSLLISNTHDWNIFFQNKRESFIHNQHVMLGLPKTAVQLPVHQYKEITGNLCRQRAPLEMQKFAFCCKSQGETDWERQNSQNVMRQLGEEEDFRQQCEH